MRVSGHDRLSIAQSFLAAGAQYVIATRYPVPDELAFRFAREFYECLWSGSAPDELMIPGAYFEAIRRLESESEAIGLSVKLLYELIM